jgi:hypothetical protein
MKFFALFRLRSHFLAIATAFLVGTSSQAAVISYVGKISDTTNFDPYGNAGFWFPRFGLSSPQIGLARDAGAFTASLPSWATFDYTTGAQRTFSLDNGGVGSEGGNTTFASVTLPDGTFGLSGATFDPRAINNSNNSVNRIQLGSGTPTDFYFSIVTDNTAGKYDSLNRVRARGDDNGANVEASIYPGSGAPITFNGIPDVYVFKYSGFGAGDFIKIQFNSGSNPNGPGFGGLLFDLTDPTAIPEASSVVMLGAAGTLLLLLTPAIRRSRRNGDLPKLGVE